jgi:hypothetical protein
MAGLICSVTTGGATGLTAVALAAATEKCLIVLTAPAQQRLKLKSLGIYFDGISSTAVPVQIVIARASSAGTSTAATPARTGAGSETPQATAGVDASANPTKGDILEIMNCHPQGGYKNLHPFSDEVLVPGGGRVAVYAKAAAAVNLSATLVYEE